MNGFPCPAICQPHCSKIEKLCLGVRDERGCSRAGSCAESNVVNGVTCPPICLVKCSKMQIQCPGSIDKNGCPSEDYCVKNGKNRITV